MKKSLAIGRFDERRIKLIYCGCTFLPSLGCWNLLILQRSVYHNQCTCNIHILLHCTYSCLQHSQGPRSNFEIGRYCGGGGGGGGEGSTRHFFLLTLYNFLKIPDSPNPWLFLVVYLTCCRPPATRLLDYQYTSLYQYFR